MVPENLYAAYGALMRASVMAEICPEAKIIGTGKLENYRLMFIGDKYYSSATIEESAGFYAPVVFWSLPADGEDLIGDALERFGDYHLAEIPAVIDGEKITVTTHVKDETGRLNPPANRYYVDIHSAYEAHGFDTDVLEEAVEYSERRLSSVASEHVDADEFNRRRASFLANEHIGGRIWEQQPNETGKAYEAFLAYRDLGAGRTLADVARELDKSYSLIRRWRDAGDWDARAAAWDSHITEKAAEKAAQEYAQMIERQINIGKMLQARAAKAIQSIDMNKIPARALPSLVKMLESGVRIEQSAREIATGQNQRQTLTINIVAADDDSAGGEVSA